MKTEHFYFLDRLRESGATNMWGATPYLEEEFNLPHNEASKIHLAWMKTFDHDKTPAERVELALKETA